MGDIEVSFRIHVGYVFNKTTLLLPRKKYTSTITMTTKLLISTVQVFCIILWSYVRILLHIFSCCCGAVLLLEFNFPKANSQ